MNTTNSQEAVLGEGLGEGNYRIGFLFIAISAIAWSTGGMFVRILPLDAWTILFWRSLFATGFLAVYLCVIRPKYSLFPKGHAMIVAGSLALTMLAFIPACQLTSIANVAAIYVTTPVFTAILAWLWLGEKIGPTTICAVVTILIGSCVLVEGTSSASDFFGSSFAFATTLITAAVTVFIRGHREQSPLASVCLANILVSLVSLCFAAPLSANLRDLVWLALFGLVQVVMAFVLFSAGLRRVPASQGSLIGAIETPLAPLWVWLGFGETPSLSTLIGGTIITVAAVGYFLAMAGGRGCPKGENVDE
ncbi:DMT family transporter [Mesorhizobium humile]|uniref:EamA family transporter n=1 Tax=Mesorhizobium humile TaxID=3072313 RepID=A0ABU4YPG7_9HYPH|nr:MULTISPECIES: EamA family transporter [unclassified Mesorhizobium]MDX8462457.1 EamA family transporter [Mesorhizobium sp. VK2D]MDX8487657.1 EamA family transporter [Mesorhizobium sp. VK2B]